jgi:hypothetical protein
MLMRRPNEPMNASGTFVFKETTVEACFSDGKWHVTANGHEAINTHLGEATRILLAPIAKGSTSTLIAEILTWHESAQASESMRVSLEARVPATRTPRTS